MAECLDRNYENHSSTTWKRQYAEAWLEPDNCFYFQNEAAVRGSLDIELDRGVPLLDLALEIDITNKSLKRFPLYARLGVSKLLCHDRGSLKIYRLVNSDYQEVPQSGIFPNIAIPDLPQLIERYLTPAAYAQAVACTIDSAPRQLTQPSDHTPVVLELGS